MKCTGLSLYLRVQNNVKSTTIFLHVTKTIMFSFPTQNSSVFCQMYVRSWLGYKVLCPRVTYDFATGKEAETLETVACIPRLF